MTRTCQRCPADISHRSKRALYCVACGVIVNREQARKHCQAYNKRRTQNRHPLAAFGKRNKNHTYDRLKIELQKMHAMGKDYTPERWPVEVLAERYELPVKMVQSLVQDRGEG